MSDNDNNIQNKNTIKNDAQHFVKTSVKTTGHEWDGIQELDNPLPRWWVWAFYATTIFTVVYWLFYPAWPIGNSFTKGVPGFNSVTYTAHTVDGKDVQKTTHWNMRSQFMRDTNLWQAQQKPWFDKVSSLAPEDVAKNAELMQFVNSAGKTLFSENCAACHQQGAQGKVGFSPNLTDDYWQYGGSYSNIETTLIGGHQGYMPAFKEILSEEEITQLANYVLSLSNLEHDEKLVAAGNALFHADKAGCYICHGNNAQGRIELGSANLVDKIWLWVDIPHDKTKEQKVNHIKEVLYGGLNRGVMPAWGERLKPEQIKLLTIYVHDTLGGGK